MISNCTHQQYNYLKQYDYYGRGTGSNKFHTYVVIDTKKYQDTANKSSKACTHEEWQRIQRMFHAHVAKLETHKTPNVHMVVEDAH